jgi:hypothetical protein
VPAQALEILRIPLHRLQLFDKSHDAAPSLEVTFGSWAPTIGGQASHVHGNLQRRDGRPWQVLPEASCRAHRPVAVRGAYGTRGERWGVESEGTSNRWKPCQRGTFYEQQATTATCTHLGFPGASVPLGLVGRQREDEEAPLCTLDDAYTVLRTICVLRKLLIRRRWCEALEASSLDAAVAAVF